MEEKIERWMDWEVKEQEMSDWRDGRGGWVAKEVWKEGRKQDEDGGKR